MRVCRDALRPRRDPRRGRQRRQRQRRDRRAGLSPTPWRCATRPPPELGLAPERGRGRRDRGDRRAAADRRGARRASARPPRVCRRPAATAFSEAILTTDRWPKRCTVRAGGVTLSAQAKGAGMIQPGFATMLCFVQTDAVVEDPDAALRAAVDASFERITVDGQMSTNDTVLLQASGAAGAPLPARPARRRPAAARDRDRRATARARPGSAGSRSRAPPRPRRPSGSPARSPTRRWSRPPSSAATRTGAGSPRPPAWRSPARTSRSSAPSAIDAAELGERGAGGRDRPAARPRRARRPRLVLATWLRVRADQRGVHDLSRDRK